MNNKSNGDGYECTCNDDWSGTNCETCQFNTQYNTNGT